MNKLKNKTGYFLTALFLVLVGAVESARAEVATHNFTGTITSVSGTLFGLSPSIGQQVQGSVTYDTSLPPAFDTGTVAGYIQPLPSGMSVVIGGATVTNDGVASLQVINDFNLTAINPCRTLQGPLDNINGFVGGSSNGFLYVNGQKQAKSSFLAFSLTDFAQQALASTALPTSLDFLSFDTNDRVGCIYDAASGGRVDFSVDPAAPPAIAVTIDVKPGGFPNSINLNGQGVTPVAILTTNPSDNVATFDAATVDATTVRFGPMGTEATPVHDAIEDVDGDGDIDMILQFRTQDTGITCGDSSATLTGATFDGQAIKGTDSIKTVGCN